MLSTPRRDLAELPRISLLRPYEKSRMHRRRSFQNYRNATFWPISLHRLTGFAVEASLETTFHTVSLRGCRLDPVWWTPESLEASLRGGSPHAQEYRGSLHGGVQG